MQKFKINKLWRNANHISTMISIFYLYKFSTVVSNIFANLIACFTFGILISFSHCENVFCFIPRIFDISL
nr:MAG TPA: hypothetical protein [Caudoviricetes sp.]